MSAVTTDSRPIAEDAEAVTLPRTRLVRIGWIYVVLGIGLLEFARRVPENDVAFTFGIPPDAPTLSLDPGGAVLGIGALLLLAGIAGVLERRLGRVTSIALIVATAAFVPLVLILSLAYSTSSQQTNLIPLIQQSLVQSTPIALGALAGLWSERSGVVNIGIEGMMLAGAGGGFMTYAVMGQAEGGFWLYASVVVAVIVGGLMAALHAVLTVTFRTDQIISGVVINLLALGLTSYLRQQVIVPAGVGTGIRPDDIMIPGLHRLPIIGDLFVGQPIYLSMFLLLLGSAYLMFRTPFGLRVRSVGENPHAAETLGIDPVRVRYAAVILGGLIAGLGGAWFSLESVGRFEDNMTNGAGFIALAALIFGKWRPWPAFGGALLFGFANAFGIRLQSLSVTLEDVRFLGVPVPTLEIPSQLAQSLPYVVTIIVLAGVIGRAIAPAAVGQPFEPSK
ncbi:ABC transporter permease [Euzebya tangerina]|uniref:ABC transporter permease n=1 Tax=Euzebya tangerina TaxID=591198 RepID=UPI000E31546C|nr:ABC transporter permease [Euzebya tangerina]